MQWKHPGSPPPKKFKRVSSAGNVMVSIVWDSQGVVMMYYLEQSSMINGAYYAEELRRLREEIVKKRRGKLTRGVELLQDNAPAHTFQVAIWLLRLNAASRSFLNPVFSRLTPSGFYLFRNLNTNLRGRNFGSNEVVIDAVDEQFGDQEEGFYFEGKHKLEQLLRKCIETKGDYI